MAKGPLTKLAKAWGFAFWFRKPSGKAFTGIIATCKWAVSNFIQLVDVDQKKHVSTGKANWSHRFFFFPRSPASGNLQSCAISMDLWPEREDPGAEMAPSQENMFDQEGSLSLTSLLEDLDFRWLLDFKCLKTNLRCLESPSDPYKMGP